MSMNSLKTLGLSVMIAALPATVALANGCANPNAIGVSRVLNVKPAEFPLVGKLQYAESLRLKEREVVLTFDDGPSAPYTGTILDVLASECVKATFFMMGSNVNDAPDLVRRAFNEGHNVGTHTFDHENLNDVPLDKAKVEIDKGITATAEAIGGADKLAPFFRPPYLEIGKPAERYALSKGLMVWSADADSEDWKQPTEEVFVATAIAELEKNRGGILLMHDTQPVTARAIGMLLAELKAKKFTIVHVVPVKANKTLAAGAVR